MQREGKEAGTGTRGEGYAEQRELKSLSFHGVDFFIQALSGLLVYPALPAEFMEI